jgi:hypothetical protein
MSAVLQIPRALQARSGRPGESDCSGRIQITASGTRGGPDALRYDAPVEPIDLAAAADDFDREVAITPEIDRFCSSSAWILAAAAALMPPRAPASYRGTDGYFAAMRGVHPAGFPYIEPVELAWGP